MDTITKEGLTLTISQDTDAESPREWGSSLGTMVCWSKRYTLGDKHNFADSADLMNSVDIAISLPLYLYDHSGITMSTKPFSCSWDSGQVGWIYVTKEKIKEEYGVKKITKKILEQVTKVLISEVQNYDQYLTGDVWYYKIEDEDGEVIDSCGGFYGSDYAEKEAKEQLEWHIEDRKAEDAKTAQIMHL